MNEKIVMQVTSEGLKEFKKELSNLANNPYNYYELVNSINNNPTYYPIRLMSKAKINFKNIKGFIQGNFRKLVEDLPGVVPDYIYEQIQYRLGIMDETCIKNGMCPCECTVPQKQYEDRPCENFCYPKMMSEKDWSYFKELTSITKESIEKKLYERKDILWPS